MDAKDLVDVLVEQNKTYKEMMQFAITSIITLLVIFLTANFFVMRKMRKDEIERVKTEIVQEIEANSLPNIHGQLNNQMESLLGDKLNTFEKKLEVLSAQSEVFNNRFKSVDKSFKNRVVKLKGDFSNLKAELNEEEHPYTAFNEYMNALGYYMEAGYSALAQDIFEDLERCANNLDSLSYELTDFLTFSKTLDEEYQYHIDRVIKVLESKKESHAN